MNEMYDKFGSSEKEWQLLQSLLASNVNIKNVLYGSRVKGSFKKFSDVDITLIGSSLTRVDVLGLKSLFEDSSFPYTVDLSVMSMLKNEDLKNHIYRRGIVIYENSSVM